MSGVLVVEVVGGVLDVYEGNRLHVDEGDMLGDRVVGVGMSDHNRGGAGRTGR